MRPLSDPKRCACPNPNGPDLDISVPPVLKTLPNGKRVLIAGTKRGHVFALDPDDRGKLLYRVLASTGAPPPANAPAGRGGGDGTIVWGGAADDQHVYFGAQSAGLTALRLGTGERVWSFAVPTGRAGQLQWRLRQLFPESCLKHRRLECSMPSPPQTESNCGNTTQPRT